MAGAHTALPRAQVGRAGARRIRSGQVWVFRADVERAPEATGGAIVEVVDAQENFIGQAFWAARSKLALRVLSRDREPIGPAQFRERMRRALERRLRMYPGADAFRVIHGESDLLPGLIVDRFGDALTVQTLSEGADLRKREWAQALAELLPVRTIALRDDGSSRDFEGLGREKALFLGTDASARFHEGEIAYEIDLLADHKTGSFLDQRENHLLARSCARGRGLDTFSYHGGFALQLAGGCSEVIAVEQDERAASRIEANARANGIANVQVRNANAFDVLRELERAGERFEVVVLDPPAFTKRKEGVHAAARAYKELNLRAFKLLAPDGILITCSCSARMLPELFEEIVLDAATDAGRTAQLLEKRGAARDHPMLAAVPETAYLKCYVYRAL